jgi:hypothetical protein
MNTNPELGSNSAFTKSLNIAFKLSDVAVTELVKPLITDEGYQRRLQLDNNMIRLHLRGQYDPQYHVSDHDHDFAIDAINEEITNSTRGEHSADALYFDGAFCEPRIRIMRNPATGQHQPYRVGMEFGLALEADSADFVEQLVRKSLRLRPLRHAVRKGNMPHNAVSIFIPEGDIDTHASKDVNDAVQSHLKNANKAIYEDSKKPPRRLHIPKRFIEPVVFLEKQAFS